MKGIIFTEFIALVEKKWGLKMVNDVIEEADDPIDGAYVSTGNYDHHNLVELITTLHHKSGIPVRDLMEIYGRSLFNKLIEHWYFDFQFDSTFDMLFNIESMIHAEVKKLYPDSMPPKFTCERLNDGQLKMVYQSHRCMGPVAKGLMLGCADYYSENIEVKIVNTSESGDEVEFLLSKTA
jgi:hypothetical protein